MIAGPTSDQVYVMRIHQSVNHLWNGLRILQQVYKFACDLRLLMDLFEHKMSITTFLSSFHVFGYSYKFPFDDLAILHTAKLNPVMLKDDNLTIFDIKDIICDW